MKSSLALVKTDLPTGQEIALHFKERLATALSSGEQLDLLDVAQETASRRTRERLREQCAEMVFAYYSSRLGHPKALLTPERSRLICRRLQECADNVSALLYAIDGVKADDWVMGRATKATKRRDTPEFIFRDWGQVERFAEERPDYNDGKPHPLAVKYGLEALG